MNFRFIDISYRQCVLFFILLLFAIPHTAKGQNLDYQEFERIPLNDMLSVMSFVQDPLGMMWLGTNKGIYSYDGSILRKIMPPKDFSQDMTIIFSGVLLDEEHIWFGTGGGMFVYNFRNDQYEMPPVKIQLDIRCMLLWEGTLWIGSIQGLYKYHVADRKLEKVNDPAIPHSAIYSLTRSEDGLFYVGTHDGLCIYDPVQDAYKEVELRNTVDKSELHIHTLYSDSARQCVWVGTTEGLYKYNPLKQVPEKVTLLGRNTIKSIAADYNQNLLLGTDNGLYIYNPENRFFQHITHDSRNSQSLVNNIIMQIFVDCRRNVWIGTNAGGAIYHHDRAYQFIPLSQITGSGDGNSFISIFKDSQHNLWLGGTEGLIKTPDTFTNMQDTHIWYRMDDKDFPLRNNLVRDIYEDRERCIWLATDGGVGRIDPVSKQVIYYNITDSTCRYNSNYWVYSLSEDTQNRLWIATWLGGIFVVDKTSLIHSAGGKYVAEHHFSQENGLTNSHIYKLVKDLSGNMWVICEGLCKIDMRTLQVKKMVLYNDRQEEILPYFKHMLCDKEGYIWVGVNYGICRINPKTEEVNYIHFENLEREGIGAIVEVDDQIWVSSLDGMIIVEKKSLKAGYFGFPGRKFSGSYYDVLFGNIVFGGVDGIALFSKKLPLMNVHDSPIYLTGLFVNGEPFQPVGESIRYLSSVKLNYNQNNFVFEFSDLLYSLQSKKIAYRMEGIDDDWKMLRLGSNHITYTNLSPGKYTLFISSLDTRGNPSEHQLSFDLIIQPPWYYSGLAKFIYVVLLLGLILWTINYFKVKNRLKIERINKEKSLELSRLKIDFFTDISHEFKTPLSLIIAPLSKLILEVKNPLLEMKLKRVEQNALHLSALINKALDFRRVDQNEQTMICSTVDMIGFSRNIFDSHVALFADKQIDARFMSSVETLYMPVDLLKMESVFNNLFSNALKYTEPTGSITMSVGYDDVSELLKICIADSGIGISQDEIPYVFNRFFQSKNAKGKEGAGVGLYLVKSYVELHGGTVDVESSAGEGTCFTVTLPVEVGLPVVQEGLQDDESGSHTDKPLVLVVDDNAQIVEFISESLKPDYRVVVAYEGKSGLELCRKIVPDFIIADVMMPVMDGLEMCRQIRKQVLFGSTPIIMLTAKDDMETERKSVDIGVECFIPKPFDVKLLMSRIRQLTGVRKQLEQKLRIESLAEPSKIEVISGDERFLAKITEIIEDKVADPDFNVNALASISGTNTKQLYRKIKQLTGKNTVEYIKSIRLKKAAMLLSEKKFSISEVVYLVGFSSHSYFTICFQKEFGKTPKQFMEEA